MDEPEVRPCDPAGDEFEYAPGLLFVIDNTTAGKIGEQPRRGRERKGEHRTVVFTVGRGGGLNEYALTVAPGRMLAGPFEPRDGSMPPWADEPIRVTYPGGAGQMGIAAFPAPDPDIR